MPVQGHISLSKLAGQIRSVITTAFAQRTYWVVADVLDYRLHQQSGAHYFCLAEKDLATHSVKAKISAVAWRDGGALSLESFERMTGQRFTSDINVLVNVSVNYTAAYGLQLVLNDVDTTYTIGILEQQRRKTLEDLLRLCPDYIRFQGDRFHTRNSSLTHAHVIQKIAVVTSSGAAGYKDFKETIEKNKHGYMVIMDEYFVSVQGESNAKAVCDKLVAIFQAKIKYDAVVIIRGGGSQSDLLIFDQFVLARAVAKFPIPVISGIGHHINETIVDLMSHTSVKTPSIAAEFIISHNKSFEESILALQKAVVVKSQNLLASKQNSLSRLNISLIGNSGRLMSKNKEALNHCYQVTVNSSRSVLNRQKTGLTDLCSRLLSKPKIIVGNRLNDLANIAHNLKAYCGKYISFKSGYLGHYVSVIKILSPESTLRRGFAIVRFKGRVVSNALQLNPHDKITIHLTGTEIEATVNSKKQLNASQHDL